jgi:heme/copper-type cytochrome/quinol oxidase subunit 3
MRGTSRNVAVDTEKLLPHENGYGIQQPPKRGNDERGATPMSATAEHVVHHDHHGPREWPADPQYGTASAGKIGMWIFLLSDALSFSGLLLAYGILRGGSDVWHNPGEPHLGINFTAGLTFLLICSSVTMVLAFAAATEHKRKQMCLFLGLTILGGVLFLCGQAYEYTGLIHEGLIFGRSAYASTFYVVTSFHGMHVLTGVIYLTVILIQAAKGKYDHDYNRVEIVGLFWHFVDLIWILVFTLIYLIP